MGRKRRKGHRKIVFSIQSKGIGKIHRKYQTAQVFKAVTNGQLSLATFLLKQGINAKFRDDYDRTLLHVNAICGTSANARRLVRAGCRLNFINRVGDTPLHDALTYNNVKVAKQLIKLGANVCAKNRNGRTPLHLSVKLGNIKLIKLIIRKGALLRGCDFDNIGALHLAIQAENKEVICLLIDEGIVVNNVSPCVSALHLAVNANNIDIVNILIDAGAEVNHSDRNGASPLQYSVYTNNLEIAKILLDAGADIDHCNKMGITTLHEAIMYKNEPIIDLLLKRGANVHIKTQEGDTPLHWAAMLNTGCTHASIIKKLLECGSDVNVYNAGQQIPFQYVVRVGDKDTVSLFMDYQPDVMKVDSEGDTSVHYAIYNEDIEVLRMILDRGPLIDQKCGFGLTALHHACRQSKPEFVRELIARGADVDAVDTYGRTPLFFSVTEPFGVYTIERPKIIEERMQVIKILLESGCNLNLRYFERKWSILDVTVQRMDVKISIMIIEYAAKVEAEIDRAVFDEYNITVIENYAVLKSYYESCLSELIAMQSRKIRDTLISYLNVLTKPMDVVVKYARNSELVKEFTDNSCELTFRIYGAQMKAKFDKALAKQIQIEKVSTILSSALEFADPTNLFFEIVVQHLNEADVDLLIDSAFTDDSDSG